MQARDSGQLTGCAEVRMTQSQQGHLVGREIPMGVRAGRQVTGRQVGQSWALQPCHVWCLQLAWVNGPGHGLWNEGVP